MICIYMCIISKGAAFKYTESINILIFVIYYDRHADMGWTGIFSLAWALWYLAYYYPFLWYGLLARIYFFIGPWPIGAAISLSTSHSSHKKLTPPKKKGAGNLERRFVHRYRSDWLSTLLRLISFLSVHPLGADSF